MVPCFVSVCVHRSSESSNFCNKKFWKRHYKI